MGKKSRQREQQRTEREHVVAEVGTREPAAPRIDRQPLFIAMAILLVAIIAVFAQLRSQKFITYDDPTYVSQNTTVQKGLTAENIGWAFTSFHGFHWHPLTTISHLADVELFGLDPGAHKLVNVVFHAGASILLLLFLVRATGALWPSAAVALLFALHPTRVESVAWVAERKDVLSAFFWMAALHLYAGYVQSGRKVVRLLAVAVAFACALLSKPSAVTLPFVLLLLDYWPFRRFERARIVSLIAEKTVLFALIIPSVVLTMRAQSVAVANSPFVDRITNMLLSTVSYLRMLVWPAKLAVFYPYRSVVSSVSVVLAGLLLLAITLVALRFFRRAPFVTVGWLWFLGTLVPMSGIVQAGRQSMADRFTYIPFVGLFIAIAFGVHAIVERRTQFRRAAVAIAAVVILAFGVVSFIQASYWKNSETLFSRALAVTSRNALAHAIVGSALFDRGAVQDALAQYRASVSIDPRSAMAQNGLGFALAATGDTEGASQAFRQAIALDPALGSAYRRLAEIELRAGRNSAAIALLEKGHSVAHDPAASAELAAARGDLDGALVHYATAVAQKPDDVELRNNHAAMLARKGRDAEALAEYREAVRLRPEYYEARMNIGALVSRLGMEAEAIEHFGAASAIRPNSAEPHIYLALVFANGGQVARATAEVDAALKIDAAAANKLFTDAVRIPFKETNLLEFRNALQAQAR